MTDFDSYIKDLETEVEALKTVKRKSSLTMATITKTIQASATIDTSGQVAIISSVPFIKFDPKQPENPFVFSWTLAPYSERNRDIQVLPWLDGDDYGVILIPSPNNTDTPGTISVSITITSTGDYSPIITQIAWEQ